MDRIVIEINKLEIEGDKFSIKTSSFIRSFFGYEENFEEKALEFYNQAILMAVTNNLWEHASRISFKAGDIKQSNFDKKKHYNNACIYILKSEDIFKVDKVILYYNILIGICLSDGKFKEAGNYCVLIADIYAKINSSEYDIDRAIKWYTTGYDYFNKESTYTSEMSKCMDKLAMLYADNENYSESVKCFEKIIEDKKSKNEGTNLNGFLLKPFFRKCLIVCCVYDIIKSKNLLNDYCNIDNNFRTSPEYNFISKIIESVEENNSEKLRDVCFEFDKINNLTPWETGLLLIVKKSIEDINEVDLS